MACKICGEPCEYLNRLCDGCWYGMRMDPEVWRFEMLKRGIDIDERLKRL